MTVIERREAPNFNSSQSLSICLVLWSRSNGNQALQTVRHLAFWLQSCFLVIFKFSEAGVSSFEVKTASLAAEALKNPSIRTARFPKSHPGEGQGAGRIARALTVRREGTRKGSCSGAACFFVSCPARCDGRVCLRCTVRERAWGATKACHWTHSRSRSRQMRGQVANEVRCCVSGVSTL